MSQRAPNIDAQRIARTLFKTYILQTGTKTHQKQIIKDAMRLQIRVNQNKIQARLT